MRRDRTRENSPDLLRGQLIGDSLSDIVKHRFLRDGLQWLFLRPCQARPPVIGNHAASAPLEIRQECPHAGKVPQLPGTDAPGELGKDLVDECCEVSALERWNLAKNPRTDHDMVELVDADPGLLIPQRDGAAE